MFDYNEAYKKGSDFLTKYAKNIDNILEQEEIDIDIETGIIQDERDEI